MFRYLTQSGELLDPYTGRRSSGPVGVKSGLISRKSELRDIDEQLTQVDERIEAMTERLDRTSAEMQQLEAVQQELRHSAFRDQEVGSREQCIEKPGPERDRSPESRAAAVAGEMQSLDMQMGEADQRRARAAESLQQLDQQNAEREMRIRDYDGQIDGDRRAADRGWPSA